MRASGGHLAGRVTRHDLRRAGWDCARAGRVGGVSDPRRYRCRVVASGHDAIAEVVEQAAGLGAWIPWSTVGTVSASVVLCMGIGLTIKLVRIVASFFTAGGGAAG